jgi:hypothetical protein
MQAVAFHRGGVESSETSAGIFRIQRKINRFVLSVHTDNLQDSLKVQLLQFLRELIKYPVV